MKAAGAEVQAAVLGCDLSGSILKRDRYRRAKLPRRKIEPFDIALDECLHPGQAAGGFCVPGFNNQFVPSRAYRAISSHRNGVPRAISHAAWRPNTSARYLGERP